MEQFSTSKGEGSNGPKLPPLGEQPIHSSSNESSAPWSEFVRDLQHGTPDPLAQMNHEQEMAKMGSSQLRENSADSNPFLDSIPFTNQSSNITHTEEETQKRDIKSESTSTSVAYNIFWYIWVMGCFGLGMLIATSMLGEEFSLFLSWLKELTAGKS